MHIYFDYLRFFDNSISTKLFVIAQGSLDKQDNF